MKPLLPASKFDYLSLIRASCADALEEPEEDLGIDLDDNPSPAVLPSALSSQTSVSPVSSASTVLGKRKDSGQSLRNSKRANKRKRVAKESTPNAQPSSRTLSEVLSHGTAIEVNHNAADFDAARGAHTGKPGTKEKLGSRTEIQKEYTVEDLLELGFEHIRWDGRCVATFS